ncbi:MAG: PEP-CTERM sorting domain-containing protein [Verrucomicrobia bacterium]|nr:PEP-CTERM sorting domain-containing protein [Verrucomicrobiota bacterium]
MSTRRWWVSLAVVFCLLGGADAATLSTTVQGVSSQFIVGPTDRAAAHAVDGSGLDTNSPPGHTSQPNGFMWLNTGDGSFGGGADPDPPGQLADITFNLGGASFVDSFRVWNYNELNNFNDRSIQTLTISTAASASGPFTPLINASNSTTTFTFAQAPGTSGYTGQLFTFSTPFIAAFVRFDIKSNYDAAGTDHGFVGLAEIQFYGSAVPEPSVWVLLGTGLLAVVLWRRSRRAGA